LPVEIKPGPGPECRGDALVGGHELTAIHRIGAADTNQAVGDVDDAALAADRTNRNHVCGIGNRISADRYGIGIGRGCTNAEGDG